MNPRVKDALLWGVVGFLTFLVLLQGYELLENVRVDLEIKAGAAVVVFVATTVITYVANGRVDRPEEGTATARESSPVVGDPERDGDSTVAASVGDGGADEDLDAAEADEDPGTAEADEKNSDERAE